MSCFADRTIALFDAGGTLVTLDGERVRAVVRAAGIEPSDTEIERSEARARRWAGAALAQGLDREALWRGYFGRMLAEWGVSDAAAGEIVRALWRAHTERGLWRRPIDGVRETLAALAASGRRMAVVSNAEGQIEQDLHEVGLGMFFDCIVDSHVVGVAKPDPRIFRIALDALGADPADCVYVGDVPAFDVDGARAAGIDPVLIDPHRLYADVDVVRVAAIGELLPLFGISGNDRQRE